MLDEIMQNEELRKRRLTDLYEEGIIQLGDEIPYKHNEETYLSPKGRNGYDDQTFSTKDVNIKWQAIGVEEISGEKCLKLIAQQPIFQLRLDGARACVYGIEEMNAMSRLFATGIGALKGRSITIEDVNQLLDVVVDEKEKKVYQVGNANDINLYFGRFLQSYNLREKQYTPESFLVNKYAKVIIHTAYSYCKNSIKGKEKEKKILFLKDGYWLASPGVDVYSYGGSAFFGPGAVVDGSANSGFGLFSSDGRWNACRLAVRPVLYLNSNVTLNVLLEESCKKDKDTLQTLLRQLEEKRQERQRIYEEEEKIIRQIKVLKK